MIFEIAAAAVFVVLLILVSIIIINNNSDDSPTTVINSYNNYTYVYDNAQNYAYLDDYRNDFILTRTSTGKPYFVDDYDSKRYLRYDSWAKYENVDGIFSDVPTYTVFVENREYTGGYFKVTFFFKDYYGNTVGKTMMKYIGPEETGKFVMKKPYSQRTKHMSWSYDVNSITKISVDNERYLKEMPHRSRIYFYD